MAPWTGSAPGRGARRPPNASRNVTVRRFFGRTRGDPPLSARLRRRTGRRDGTGAPLRPVAQDGPGNPRNDPGPRKKPFARGAALRSRQAMHTRRAVHPLLLDPSYWRERIESIESDAVGVVWTPRPDLSGSGKDVTEFRIRTHDGGRLWGLFARPTWQKGPWPAVVRSVGPADRPEVTAPLVRSGSAEFVFQEPAGRRLADRVLDVMQVCRFALETHGIDGVEVEAPEPATEESSRGACRNGAGADELVIAEHLMTQHRMTEQWQPTCPPHNPL